MARHVTLTIRYDMDDPDKSLKDELLDWANCTVDLYDLVGADASKRLVIESTGEVVIANDKAPEYWVTLREDPK